MKISKKGLSIKKKSFTVKPKGQSKPNPRGKYA